MATKRSNKKENRTKTRLKNDDEVIVISGKNRQSRGKVLAVDKEKQRVIVQGVNMRKQFARPSQENPQGGIVEREAPLHISNVQFYDSKAKKGSRIRIEEDKNGNKVRVAVASGRQID